MDPLVGKLMAVAEEDLAAFEELQRICAQQIRCLGSDDLEALPAIVEEKEKLIQKIQQRSEEFAPLWAQVGEAAGRENLYQRVEKIRDTLETIQKSENQISEVLTRRADAVRKALGSLAQGGKAVNAYKPIRSYAPRFVDRKE